MVVGSEVGVDGQDNGSLAQSNGILAALGDGGVMGDKGRGERSEFGGVASSEDASVDEGGVTFGGNACVDDTTKDGRGRGDTTSIVETLADGAGGAASGEGVGEGEGNTDAEGDGATTDGGVIS